MDEESLPRVALWVISCFACVVCCLRGCGCIPLSVGLSWRRWLRVSSRPRPLADDCWQCVRLLWRAESSHPRTDGTAMVCVCEGWCGVAGQGEGRGGAFLVCRLFVLLAFFSCNLLFLLSWVE
ncbi:trans-sialidase [Trypanosoma cruzi cruzi]|nr:trans-sialidase [Trypanosoma cruzi cruzi]